ncbi:MAG: methionine--tRNA ligase [Alphaproteobacteria bacterium]|nr:methionine--tRNA ligase [Alphaproteobacteria bacterium]
MAKILITSALPYINGIKHLGNLIGSMLSADVYARFMRAAGNTVLFICATDEHGTPAEIAAHEEGLPVEEYCRKQHEIQAQIYRDFALSFDYFGRSSSPQNHELTNHFYHRLDDAGLIEERAIAQVYSIDDGRFLPDRYITGTCPHCGYPNARGDQCENCTRLLEPTDLKDARSAISGSSNLEVRETKHLFLKLPVLADRVEAWIDSQKDWPLLVSSIAKGWLKEGLQDRGITRDLKWGVPVDRPGFEGKVFYVWFDAPIEYIGATKEWADAAPPGEMRDWKAWWYDAHDVRYVEFMAKDNVPFHTVSFPATILGSGEPWKLADYIKGFSWLNFYGGKFSTSQKRGIFLDQALAEYPSDYWRYWLLANAPETDDTSFTFGGFAGVCNKDLADTFGNFVNRTLRFCSARFGDAVPAGGKPGPMEGELTASVQTTLDRYTAALGAMQLRRAAEALRELWVLGNVYIDRAAPWTAIKTDKDRAAIILRTAINLARLYAILGSPIIPDTCARLREALGVTVGDDYWPNDAAAELAALPAGHAFSVPPPLFKKIAPEEVVALAARYGGDEAGEGAA